jgi:DNA processing protein
MSSHRDSEREAWIALASTLGVGDVTLGRLLERFGSASGALAGVARLPGGDADARLARDLEMRLRPGLAAAIRASAADPRGPARHMERLGGWILTPHDAGYPARLMDLEEPPAVLYGLGDPASLTRSRMVAVVGTRRPTAFGRDLSGRIARRLVDAGAAVVSGLALGVDGAAHLSAIEAAGTTVAVVGGGPDAPGPAVHRRLARSITEHGALVSEQPPGRPPTRGTFPRRNRIISALASATVVVEAPARSGALITARHALEQGRSLLVAPGRPLDPRVAGNLALLRESPARPLVGLDEMVVDLGLASAVAAPAAGDPGVLSRAGALALLGDVERSVAARLCEGPRTLDALALETGLEAGVVAAAVTILQLRGWARAHGPMQLPAGPLIATRDAAA